MQCPEEECVYEGECFALHLKAGQRAQKVSQAYIFSCHANLNHIAFPLINREELLGSVIIGLFLMDKPDSTLISGIAERYQLMPALSLELYDELTGVPMITPDKAGQLQRLVDHLLSPLIPSERATLMQNQEKTYQQAKINKTIQVYKEQKLQPSLLFFHKKEKELLTKVRTCGVREVKGLLNEKFLSLIYQEWDLDDLCMLLQDVAESFMSAMFYEKDKGNSYIRKALRFIGDNYFEHLELAAVADFVQLSPGYFSTLFRQVVG